MFKATKAANYWNYITKNGIQSYSDGSFAEFGWDTKHAGINVLISKVGTLFNYIPFTFVFSGSSSSLIVQRTVNS